MSFIESLLNYFSPQKSFKWKIWKAKQDKTTCVACKSMHGRIFPYELRISEKLHAFCRCSLVGIDVIPAGIATQDGFDGADYWLVHNGKLPPNYITKSEAKQKGWKSKKGNLAEVANGKAIGGDIYKNIEGKLPHTNGRIWYEADVNYTHGYRGIERILYSNDGLVFVTYNHYESFYEISK